MALVIYSKINQGFVPFEDQNRFLVSELNTTHAVFQYDAAIAGKVYSSQDAPFRIEVFFKNAVMETATTGPHTGEDIFTSGTITKIVMSDNNGNTMWKGLGFKTDLTTFYDTYLDDHAAAWDVVMAGGHTFIGAKTNGRPANNWTGETIQTGSGNDTAKGGNGSDYFYDHGGADKYDGGKGYDYLYYWDPFHENAAASGITVNTAKAKVTGPDGAVDKIKGITHFGGSEHDDTFIGGKGYQAFTGLKGNDTMNGGKGIDAVFYFAGIDYGMANGITANLATGEIIDEFGDTDTVRNIEEVYGSDFADVFYDNGKENHFTGWNGNDIMHFSGGNDSASGGYGSDTFIYHGETFGKNKIYDFHDGVDKIQILGAASFEELTIKETRYDLIIKWNGNEVRLIDAAYYGANLGSADFDWSHAIA